MDAPDDFNPAPGTPEEVGPGIRRLLCNNPSPFTYRGTNTYLLGAGGGIAVIDPGPEDTDHMDAILAALAPGEHVSHILVTHAHRDHSPLARPLAEATSAKVWAYGDATAGMSEVMQRLAASGEMGGVLQHRKLCLVTSKGTGGESVFEGGFFIGAAANKDEVFGSRRAQVFGAGGEV